MYASGLSFHYSGVLIMTTVQTAPARRVFVRQLAAATAAIALPSLHTAHAATPPATERRFAPQAGRWRSFEVTTRVDIPRVDGVTLTHFQVGDVVGARDGVRSPLDGHRGVFADLSKGENMVG